VAAARVERMDPSRTGASTRSLAQAREGERPGADQKPLTFNRPLVAVLPNSEDVGVAEPRIAALI